MYKLKYSNTFAKDLKGLTPDSKKQLRENLNCLFKIPFINLCVLKKLQGLDNIFEMSVNMDIRILWKYENGVIILLLYVGHHEGMLGI